MKTILIIIGVVLLIAAVLYSSFGGTSRPRKKPRAPCRQACNAWSRLRGKLSNEQTCDFDSDGQDEWLVVYHYDSAICRAAEPTGRHASHHQPHRRGDLRCGARIAPASGERPVPDYDHHPVQTAAGLRVRQGPGLSRRIGCAVRCCSRRVAKDGKCHLRNRFPGLQRRLHQRSHRAADAVVPLPLGRREFGLPRLALNRQCAHRHDHPQRNPISSSRMSPPLTC